MLQSIYDTVLDARQSNQTSMLDLIEKFSPVLRRYAASLRYEDAYADLVVAFIADVHKMNPENLRIREDPGLINYFCAVKAMALAKKTRRREEKIFLAAEMDKFHVEGSLDQFLYGDCGALLFQDFSKYLTDSEAAVIYDVFYNNFSVQDIATARHTSRQAVNTTKLRALKKLRERYFIDLVYT